MVSIELPAEYGYVLAATVSTFFVGTWLGMRVGMYRKQAKIPYPYEYASYEQIQTAEPSHAKAMHEFNCAQRGHQNFNENHPIAIASFLITGLQYPRAAAILGTAWTVGRVLYALGYNNGKEGGRGRYNGAFGMVAQYVSIIWAGVSAYGFIKAA
ncbi:membrane-associated proteins in eicosanoid and glutathione metabolism [Massarina eburnea CBS 473.64]|uniref:Membrane-associated proteins in eicosanoid and glutathione metabolism n=1 Tax=Massarina eburnea CBS 473.64 TaxID=1395130 RepID=A0A6A6RU66_9PLEO|nr:membrane-associated proteins in eicosanoid and glutathione metabolism [Massarina eburnea CBS 473.64]